MRRRSHRLVVENGVVLDLAAMTRPILAARASIANATLTDNGKKVAGVELDLSQGVLMIRYPIRGAVPDRASMVTTPQPFGGVRWWVCCPRCSRRCAKLYRPDYPAAALACRRCHHLDYRSQRVSMGERWRLRASRLYAQLGTDAHASFHAKPKWMRWRTFDRRLEQANDFQEASEGYAMRGMMRFLRKHDPRFAT